MFDSYLVFSFSGPVLSTTYLDLALSAYKKYNIRFQRMTTTLPAY
jgi:hypothetical protein